MHTFKSKIYVYGRTYQFDIFFIFFLKIKFFLVREYLYKWALLPHGPASSGLLDSFMRVGTERGKGRERERGNKKYVKKM